MFEFKKISHDDPLLNEVYRLRYKVYCEEWGFERKEDHPGGIERDDFDAHSIHFVAIRKADRKLIGTTRIILHSNMGFPIEAHCHIHENILKSDKANWGEISRLAVSKEFRKRAGFDCIYKDEDPILHDVNSPFQEKRKNENTIVIGLYRCIYRDKFGERADTSLCGHGQGAVSIAQENRYRLYPGRPGNRVSRHTDTLFRLYPGNAGRLFPNQLQALPMLHRRGSVIASISTLNLSLSAHQWEMGTERAVVRIIN
jgi:Acetyltransferase (GNAT) domain